MTLSHLKTGRKSPKNTTSFVQFIASSFVGCFQQVFRWYLFRGVSDEDGEGAQKSIKSSEQQCSQMSALSVQPIVLLHKPDSPTNARVYR